MQLAEYLEQSERKRWAWGVEDCALWPANWALALTGRDPAERWRGTYSSEAEAKALIEAGGGYSELVRAGLESTGWTATETLEDGDIGVVEGVLSMSEKGPIEGQIAAIRLGSFWVVRAVRGYRGKDMEHVAAWRAPLWAHVA